MSPKGWCGMELSAFFPGVWDKLNDTQRRALTAAASPRRLAQGELLHGAGAECLGLLALQRGRLRAFMLSEAGREITLYRLFERDICLFSASCMAVSYTHLFCLHSRLSAPKGNRNQFVSLRGGL